MASSFFFLSGYTSFSFHVLTTFWIKLNLILLSYHPQVGAFFAQFVLEIIWISNYLWKWFQSIWLEQLKANWISRAIAYRISLNALNMNAVPLSPKKNTRFFFRSGQNKNKSTCFMPTHSHSFVKKIIFSLFIIDVHVYMQYDRLLNSDITH